MRCSRFRRRVLYNDILFNNLKIFSYLNIICNINKFTNNAAKGGYTSVPVRRVFVAVRRHLTLEGKVMDIEYRFYSMNTYKQ